MWYRRTVSVTEPLAVRTWLDLGQVVATCEVWINDEKAGVLVHAPFRLDVSRYMRRGKNRLAVLVYNTLANHYQTIPSPYKGKPVSGLVGPVQLMYELEK